MAGWPGMCLCMRAAQSRVKPHHISPQTGEGESIRIVDTELYEPYEATFQSFSLCGCCLALTPALLLFGLRVTASSILVNFLMLMVLSKNTCERIVKIQNLCTLECSV